MAMVFVKKNEYLFRDFNKAEKFAKRHHAIVWYLDIPELKEKTNENNQIKTQQF